MGEIKDFLSRNTDQRIQFPSTLFILVDYPVHIDTISMELSIFIPAFFFRKKKCYIDIVSKSVRRTSVCPSVRPSITFLVNVSPPKPLQVATSNIEAE